MTVFPEYIQVGEGRRRGKGKSKYGFKVYELYLRHPRCETEESEQESGQVLGEVLGYIYYSQPITYHAVAFKPSDSGHTVTLLGIYISRLDAAMEILQYLSDQRDSRLSLDLY